MVDVQGRILPVPKLQYGGRVNSIGVIIVLSVFCAFNFGGCATVVKMIIFVIASC